ncbi:transposase [Acinetobacter pollinis]|uniref:transposase n=1 Tax=Acinetobacter pollinis TaxID=2605270 RepID=UPI0018A2A4DE|nr:transposase [Acinetobacter pollinis]MBF7691255.1 transposase [Acinetobacter pollinis]MBF7693750.1 transposase [Acinetobacter pollinis]MBF7698937.1 transposase [Acinetobacter pollinis]MBF7701323.1 transposase [Acinetobacter pollinis]
MNWYILEKIVNRIAIAINGDEINVKIIPNEKRQNTTAGFMNVEVGKKVLLESGQEISLNLDGKSFYTSFNQMYKLI